MTAVSIATENSPAPKPIMPAPAKNSAAVSSGAAKITAEKAATPASRP